MTPPTTIADAAPQIASGRLRPRQLVDECLERIAQLDDQVQAWVLVDEAGARGAADELGEEASAGRCRGPLHGIPIGIKDIIDVAGMPTRAGSQLTDSAPVIDDAPVVRRLREAGAVILGKTVTTEFACFDPPPTRNPWNLGRTPGGSSSGSAAAVAAGMCIAAIGSQTGGSIIRPASYCGIAGFKPSWGRVPVEGVVPISSHLDHVGPLARCVKDLALVFEAIADEPSKAAASLSLASAPRLGLLAPYFMETADETVVQAVRDALKALGEAGAEVALASLPESFGEVHAMHRRIMAVGAAAVHQQSYERSRDKMGEHVAELIEQGLATSQETCDVALAHQRRFAKDMQQIAHDFDALIAPATPGPAPGLETTGDPRFNSPFSYSGPPTLSLPCALDQDGMPLALQLIGGHDDARLLSIGLWCERRLGFSRLPPLLEKA